MTYLSFCAGIGGIDLGLERSGMTCLGQVEINKECQMVLNRHFPGKLVGKDVASAGACLSSTNRCQPKDGDPWHPLASGAHPPALAIGVAGSDVGYALKASQSHSGDKGDGGVNTTMVAQTYGVRRLTPRECERLQGFPDDWTRWGVDASGQRVEISDSARYRMLGNAVTVNVAEWIGRQMMRVGALV